MLLFICYKYCSYFTGNGTGSVFLFAGNQSISEVIDGNRTIATFVNPTSLALTPAGSLYVGDSSHLRKIASNGTSQV